MKPNDFGKKILTDQCQQINVTDFLKEAKSQIKKTLLQSTIETEGYRVLLKQAKTGFGGVRYWFDCPLCQKRAGVLYRHPMSQVLGCRKCLRLDYRNRRFKGMIESVV